MNATNIPERRDKPSPNRPDTPTRRDSTVMPRASTPGADAKAREKAALQKLLSEIDKQESVGSASELAGGMNRKRRRRDKARDVLSSLAGRETHRSDLERARAAARKTFKVDARPSARKRAALMMGLGAMTLSTVAATGSNVQTRSVPVIQKVENVDATKHRVHTAKINVSDAFKEALIEEEGVRQTVYRDVAGYPTVGVGHLIRAEDGLRVGDRVSYDQVLDFLEDDLAIAEEGVRRLVGDLPLYQHEFDALVDLVYNVGEGNVSDRKSPRLNAAIDAQDYQAIADELNYTTAAGKKARGLEFRSDRRAAIFQTADYENPRDA